MSLNWRSSVATGPSTSAWLSVNILIPLIPFIIISFFRFITLLELSWTVFDVSDLALSFGLVSAFVRMNLINSDIVLPNEDKAEEIAGAAARCLVPLFFFLALYLGVEIFDLIVAKSHSESLQKSLLYLRLTVILMSFLFFLFFVRLQRSFKLRAKIL